MQTTLKKKRNNTVGHKWPTILSYYIKNYKLMNIYTNTNSAFPSQVVSDAEKAIEKAGVDVLAARSR